MWVGLDWVADCFGVRAKTPVESEESSIEGVENGGLAEQTVAKI